VSLLPPVVLAVALLAVSCSSSGGAARSRPDAGATGTGVPATTPAVTRVVVVGASDAVGYGADDPDHDAWPAVLEREALPEGTTLRNLGVPGSTVAEAIEEQLPDALAADADVALVWLSVNDLVAQVTPAAYERRLGELVHALRRNGATRVLVGNTPPLDRLPAFVACQSEPNCPGGALPSPPAVAAAVAAYNAVIDGVAARDGAEVVDLHAAAAAAQQRGTDSLLVSSDGFHPSTAGHRAIAEAFAAVLHRS
jgi:lysophospholipase L1-like esterase